MLRVKSTILQALASKYGEGFVLGIESSSNELGLHSGMRTYINIYINKVTERIEGISEVNHPTKN